MKNKYLLPWRKYSFTDMKNKSYQEYRRYVLNDYPHLYYTIIQTNNNEWYSDGIDYITLKDAMNDRDNNFIKMGWTLIPKEKEDIYRLLK